MTGIFTIDEVVRRSQVIPVLVIDDLDAAVPLARSLGRGGIHVVEVTLRTDAALEAIARITAEVPTAIVGAGTVTTAAEAAASVRAGAHFLVTPGSPAQLMDAVMGHGVPLLPGAATATEMLTLCERGLTTVKFFPAEASGGRTYLSALAGPLPQLTFCPTGGITATNAPGYLSLPNVACVGGSWLTPSDVVGRREWSVVEQLARQAAALSAS
jgi:2-dehydro-3-deoxyphosphogluconate aldolase/(4S)-4-hydroxy-2-oxoglutarate aldolase